METTKTVPQQVFETAVQMAENSLNILEYPAKKIANELGMKKAKITGCLKKLEELGLIERIFGTNDNGSGEMVVKIEVLKKEFPQPTVHKKPTSPKEEKQIQIQNRIPIIVLVDHDNAMMCAKEYGKFDLSLEKLRSFVRNFGQMIIGEVFLSPRSHGQESLAKRQELVQMIWNAGFKAVECPMQFKDKDAVDTKLKISTRAYAEYSIAKKIVLVSNDNDIINDPDLIEFFKDMKIEMVHLDVTKHRLELEGSDTEVSIPLSPLAEEYKKIFQLLESGLSANSAEQRDKMNLLRDTLGIVATETSRQDAYLSFYMIAERIQEKLPKLSKNIFKKNEIETVVRTLIDNGILERHSKNVSAFYKINPDHPFVIKWWNGKKFKF